MSAENMVFSILLISVLIVAGKWIRKNVAALRKLFLPSSIIGGFLALFLGPQVLGRFFGDESRWSPGLWPEPVFETWGALPGVLISVVFAALFLGKPLPNLKKIWQQSGPMVAHGQTLAWGQYVVGLSLALFVIIPVWNTSPLVGALIEIGFEGGHGTAAGLAETFRELGFADGADMALGLATIGVVMGVVLGDDRRGQFDRWLPAAVTGLETADPVRHPPQSSRPGPRVRGPGRGSHHVETTRSAKMPGQIHGHHPVRPW